MNYLVKYFFTLFVYWSLCLTKPREGRSYNVKNWSLSVLNFFVPRLYWSICMTKRDGDGISATVLIRSYYDIRIALIAGTSWTCWFDDS